MAAKSEHGAGTPGNSKRRKHNVKQVILLALMTAVLGNAGVVRVVTYPVRHPVKVVKKTVHVAKKIVW